MKSYKQLCITALAVVASGTSAAAAQAAVAEAEALTTAIHYTGAVGRKSGGLQITSSGAIPFSRAQEVFGGEVGPVGPSGAVSFPFVFSSAGHTFQANLPSPPGREAPSGRYLGLIVDASSNRVDEIYIGPTPPPIGQLGTVVTVNLTSSEAAAASASCRVEELLTASLSRKHLGARHRSAARALGACQARRR